MENTFIKLYRSIDGWGWRTNPNTLSVFLYCLTHARHTPGEYCGVKLQPGQLITGRDAISRGTGVSTQSVRTALKNLRKTGEITIKTTNKFSVVTVVNWAKFQSRNATPNQQPNQQLTNNQPAANQQLTTNNNDNNGTMEDVVGGSISSTLLQAVVDVWGNPSKSLVSGVEKLAEEHGEALVIEALRTAVEHDTEGGVSLAYVKAILANTQKAKRSERNKLHQAGLPTTEEPIEERIKKQKELIAKASKEGSATYSLYQQLKTLRDIQNPNRPKTKLERYNIVVNGETRECWREVEV